MQHRYNRSTTTNYNRANRLITARANPDPGAATQAEADIASELLDLSIIERDAVVRAQCHAQHSALTPFAATEAFSKALHAAMVHFAGQTAGKAPKSGKYDLLFATPVMFSDVWATRQIVDGFGIPYDHYVQQALAYWVACGNTRIPRPTQLCAPDVVTRVLSQWAAMANHDQVVAEMSSDSPRAA